MKVLHYQTDRGIIVLDVVDSDVGNESLLKHYAEYIKRFMGVRCISKSWVV